MNLITYIESLEELNAFVNAIDENIAKLNYELILGCSELSRYSKTSKDELLTIVNSAVKNNLPITLEWDALNQEEKFQEACAFFDRLPLHDFKAVRLQDPGAVEFVKTKYPWLKIQIILENGNHNFIGLQKWCEYLGEQCERLVLSNELSREMLRDYAALLKTPLEIQAFGRILLFYSPRLLLSPLEKTSMQNSFIEASGSSEESPHSGFPLIENRHGTFMFNVKDLYLLDHLDELSAMGISHARVDLRFDDCCKKYLKSICDLFTGKISDAEMGIKKNPVRPLIKGFYNINKTDVLFTKLKNKRTQRQDLNYVGEIVDVERDAQLALLVKTENLSDITKYDLKLITPEGKEKIVAINWMKSSLGESRMSAQKNDLVLLAYCNGVTVKTQVYLNPKT